MEIFRRIKQFALASVIAVSVCGCEAFVTDPLFSLPSEIYMGQEFKIWQISLCNYTFEDDSPYVEIYEKEKNKFVLKTIEKYTFTDGCKVNVTAHNADDPEVDPFKMEATLVDWTIGVFDKDGKYVTPLASVYNLKANTEYELSMCYASKPEEKIDDLIGAVNKDKEGYVQKINWDGTTSMASVEATSYMTAKIVTPQTTGTYTINASLNDVKRKISVIVK